MVTCWIKNGKTGAFETKVRFMDPGGPHVGHGTLAIWEAPPGRWKLYSGTQRYGTRSNKLAVGIYNVITYRFSSTAAKTSYMLPNTICLRVLIWHMHDGWIRDDITWRCWKVSGAKTNVRDIIMSNITKLPLTFCPIYTYGHLLKLC